MSTDIDERLRRRVQSIHGKVMEAFMSGSCEGVAFDSIVNCVKGQLSNVGLSVTDVKLLNLDGVETNNPDEVKYVRAVANDGQVDHIFTFAVIKRRDTYNVLYLQSAVSIK
ncbi:hypothetical protein [Caldivirga maquilingensis]|uniref:Uncharacterized protein n=1 Tax=Caldivirga maquilingensis (strain ATCC 700844 / DSM 13496 / JCM 10307 / IC-167) TaxID=397948 RepID=A8MAK6_CALMQ|nr:hypothetical protein [Caldivirga maquilingensis]ABW02583.1 conserved hypothetical protein [Caldivirga maquilingensis IC-167]